MSLWSLPCSAIASTPWLFLSPFLLCFPSHLPMPCYLFIPFPHCHSWMSRPFGSIIIHDLRWSWPPRAWESSLFPCWLSLLRPHWCAAILLMECPKPPLLLQSTSLTFSLPADASYLSKKMENVCHQLLPSVSYGYISVFFSFFVCVFFSNFFWHPYLWG